MKIKYEIKLKEKINDLFSQFQQPLYIQFSKHLTPIKHIVIQIISYL